MRFNPIKLLEGLLCTAPALLLTLAACGGGGGGSTTTTTIPVVAPSTAPSVSTPVAGCNAINLNWTAVTGATGYNVYGAASGVTPTLLAATTATSYTDAGLLLSTPRNYQVTATNSAGEGPKSATVTATTKNSCTVRGGSIQGNALTLSGAVSTLAGAGPSKFGTADGTGTAAQFNSPAGVTTDGTYLYVADTNNNAIRKIVISTGAVTTIAVTGAIFNGPVGITTDGTNLYVADTQNSRILKIAPTGVVTTIAATYAFNAPRGVTTDGTYLYVADTNNNAIRQIVISTGVVTTIAATYAFNAPQGITTDGTNLYVADTANNVIRKISGTTVTTVAGSTQGYADGTGSAAKFNLPNGITTDGTNLYIGDTANQSIRTIQ